MITHGQIWGAIDAVARSQGLTPSGLARRAGLDATSFNKSKRIAPGGRERWPSTETLARVLEASNMDLRAFAGVIDRVSSPGDADAAAAPEDTPAEVPASP